MKKIMKLLETDETRALLVSEKGAKCVRISLERRAQGRAPSTLKMDPLLSAFFAMGAAEPSNS